MPASSARQVTATTPSFPDIRTPLTTNIYPKGCRYGQRHKTVKNQTIRGFSDIFGDDSGYEREWAGAVPCMTRRDRGATIVDNNCPRHDSSA